MRKSFAGEIVLQLACTVLVIAALLLQSCSGSNTSGPRKSNAAAVQLASGATYRRVYPTFASMSAIAASDLAAGSTTGALSYLVKGAAPIRLSGNAETESVMIAPAEPASALFVDSPTENGIGNLFFVDLAASSVGAAAVKDATGVPVDGVSYGADGRQVLFISAFDPAKGLGKLRWTDGSSVNELAEGAAPGSFAFSANRAIAATVIGIDEGTLGDSCQRHCGRGNLISIDMKTGTKTNLLSDVVLFGEQGDLAFSVSADGTTVAFTTADGGVGVISTAGGEPRLVPGQGVSPAVSSDGRVIVFYADDKLYAWSGDAPSVLANTPDSVRSRFSPDNQFVYFFRSAKNADGGLVGDAWVVPVGGGEPMKLVQSVGVSTLEFNASSQRVTMVGDLLSLAGEASFRATGNLYAGKPGGAVTKVGKGSQVNGRGSITATDSIAWVGDLDGGGKTVGNAYVAAGLTQAPLLLKEGVVPGSLVASSEFDSVLFIADPTDELFEGRFRVGAVYASKTQGPAKALANATADAIHAAYSRDGRAVVAVARGDKAGVWSLPTP